MNPAANGDRVERIAGLEAHLASAATAADRLKALNELSAVIAPSDAIRARSLADVALALAREEQDEAAEATALQCLSHACYCAGAYAEALTHGGDALRRFEDFGDLKSAARTQLILAAVHIGQSRRAEATRATLTAIQLSERCGDRQGLAIAHNTLSVLYAENHDYEEALEHRLISAKIHEQLGDRYRLSMAYINIGNIHQELGNLPLAMDFQQQAIEILEQEEPRGYPLAAAYHSVGDLHRLRGETAEARRAHLHALEVRTAAGDACGRAQSSNALGELSLAEGDLESAERSFREALEQARGIGAPKDEWAACRGLANVFEAAGDLKRALELQKNAARLQEEALDQASSKHVAELVSLFDAERRQREAEIHELKFVRLEQETQRRREAERAMIQSQKLESLGLLAGGVAHDFNNMLLAVLGYAEMARDLLPDGHDAKRLIELAGESGERAADLAQQMLAYAGRRHYEMKPCDVSAVIDSSRQLLSGAAGSHVELKFDLLRGMPRIKAEASQVNQIITNLVLNAAEAGATSLAIRTDLRQMGPGDDHYWTYTGEPLEAGTYVRLSITDNGPGIERGVLERMFDPFYTTKFTGRGLGLAAVLGVVRGHQGGVCVHSAVGTGTTFRIVLPALPGAEAASVPAPTATLQAEAAPDRSLRVLVVEDDPTVCELVSRILRSAGHAVRAAADGQAAVDAMREHGSEIDLILLDMTMPGFPFTRTWDELRALSPGTPIVLTSGYDQQQALKQLPADVRFLSKPYGPGKLLLTIRQAVAPAPTLPRS